MVFEIDVQALVNLGRQRVFSPGANQDLHPHLLRRRQIRGNSITIRLGNQEEASGNRCLHQKKRNGFSMLSRRQGHTVLQWL